MKTRTEDGVIVILFVFICVLVGAFWASGSDKEEEQPSNVVPDASKVHEMPSLSDLAKGGYPSMTRFGVWSNGTNCEGTRVILWPATNVLFAFHDKPTCPEFTNGVWVIRFSP